MSRPAPAAAAAGLVKAAGMQSLGTGLAGSGGGGLFDE